MHIIKPASTVVLFSIVVCCYLTALVAQPIDGATGRQQPTFVNVTRQQESSSWHHQHQNHHQQQTPQTQNMVRVILIKANQSRQATPTVTSQREILARTVRNLMATSSAPNQLEALTSLTLHDSDGSKPNNGPRSLSNEQVVPSGLGLEAAYMEKTRPSWLTSSLQFKLDASTLGISDTRQTLLMQNVQQQAFDSPILLRTKLGIIEGVRSVKFNKKLYTFLSIPYAKAPINQLRFRAPQPVEPWKGIYQATKWPPFCVQSSMTLASQSSPVHVMSPMMNEDCLYLNIWTPSLKFRKNHRRPVMVWFHGGAFQYGGVSVDENDGSALALLGDVVVVTFNYRLNIFGFLNANNKETAPNNVGLLDQRLALEWIRDNIKSFGADPQQVTIFGESAGGHSVGLHMVSPKSYGLFKRAILQSGVPISFLRSYDGNEGGGAPAVSLARRMGCYQDPVDAEIPSEATEAQDSNNTSSTDLKRIDEDAIIESVGGGPSDERLAKRLATSAIDSAAENIDEEEEDENVPILDDTTLDCMRNRSSMEILKAMGAPGTSGFFPISNDLEGFFPNGPIMDSFDDKNPKIGPQKDYLIGVNPDEGAFLLHYGLPELFPTRSEPLVSNIEELKAALQRELERAKLPGMGPQKEKGSNSHNHLFRPFLKTTSGMVNNLMPKYNGSSFNPPLSRASTFGKGIASLITDIIFLCPARALANTLTGAKRNVYFYVFNHRSSQTQYHPWMGVTHHDEVEFVFGRPLRMADTYSGSDIEMSQRMIKIWSHFAYTGQMLNQFNITWPTYGVEDNYHMELFSNHSKVGSRYHDKVCNIYDTVISVHIQD